MELKCVENDEKCPNIIAWVDHAVKNFAIITFCVGVILPLECSPSGDLVAHSNSILMSFSMEFNKINEIEFIISYMCQNNHRHQNETT